MFNYDPTANTATECCIPVIKGCMTKGMFNYNPNANTPECCVPVKVGCMTKINQLNYDPDANTPGDCIPVIVGCRDPAATNYHAAANTCGPCTYAT